MGPYFAGAMVATDRTKCHHVVRRIRAHPYTKRIRPFNRIVCDDGSLKWVRGLSVSLKPIFFPKFKRPRLTVTERKRKHIITKSSTKVGIHVHRQLELWANKLGSPILPLADDSASPKAVTPKASPKARKSKEHLFTKHAKAALKKRGLVPVSAEVPILSVRGRFLTQIDLLCRSISDPEGNTVDVVSLKTGYHAATLKRGRRKCEHIAQRDCYLTHHFLQLGLEVACLQQEYDITVGNAFVLYVGFGGKESTHIEQLPDWAWDGTTLLTHMRGGAN
jgi:hypothetical protein